jgi:E1A/CREB-binding protein
MFENTRSYYRKMTKVYKYCSKLCQIFEHEIDLAMQTLGYCCGQKYTFNPRTLYCCNSTTCAIPRDAEYFIHQNKNLKLCYNCYSIPETFGNIDPSRPSVDVKEDFVKVKNDVLEMEPFVTCVDCSRKLHKVCVLHDKNIWKHGFTCDNCHCEVDTHISGYYFKRILVYYKGGRYWYNIYTLV